MIEFVRSRSGGLPSADTPDADLVDYALRLRAEVEKAIARLPGGRSIRDSPAMTDGVEALWVADEAAGCQPEPHGGARVLLHLHGGAYVLGSGRTHRGLAGKLSRSIAGPVLLPNYRLAPEHPYPAALDDAVTVYRWLLEDCEVPPEQIAVSGDSAGGGLAVALLLRLRDRGIALPACYVGLSPWTDLAGTGPSVTELADVDRWLVPHLLLPAGRTYAGTTALDDPFVSPLYGDLRGLPPMLVHVGSDEILRDDAVRLVARARGCGVDASVGVFAGMWHAFHAFPVPEARWAIREIGGFVRRYTG